MSWCYVLQLRTHYGCWYRNNSMTQTRLSAANGAIPHVGLLGDSSNRYIPGWSEIVEPAREKSLFWHNIWMECGRPKTGVVSDIVRQTRLAHHYSIRKVKRREKDIVADMFAGTILNNRSRYFWAEVIFIILLWINLLTAPIHTNITGRHCSNTIIQLNTSY